MCDPLIVGFCFECQHLLAPPTPECPACQAEMWPVVLEDVPEANTREIIDCMYEEGPVLLYLEDEGAHASLIADLLVRQAAA